MTYRDFGIALRRHPLVALVMITIAGVVTFATAHVRPDYEARYVITLLSPEAPFPRNSYASFSPDLVLLAQVSAEVLSSPHGRHLVRENGGTADYQVALYNRGNQELPIYDEPYLTLTATSKSAAQAQRTMQAVLTALRTQVDDSQRRRGAQPGSYISWRITKSTGQPIPVNLGSTRQLIAIVLLGAIGTIYAALLADRLEPRFPAAFRRRGGLRAAPSSNLGGTA
jgi:hypothetical protein